MSNKFSLISEYTEQGQAEKQEAVKVESLNQKVKYQEYLIEVDAQEHSVYIPIRECSKFESVLAQTTEITAFQLKNLLREFRGIRNIG